MATSPSLRQGLSLSMVQCCCKPSSRPIFVHGTVLLYCVGTLNVIRAWSPCTPIIPLGEVAEGTSLSDLPLYQAALCKWYDWGAWRPGSDHIQYNSTVQQHCNKDKDGSWRRLGEVAEGTSLSDLPLYQAALCKWYDWGAWRPGSDHDQNNNTVHHHCTQQQHKQASSAGTQDSLTHSSPCPQRQVWSQLHQAGCCVAHTSPLWHALTWPNHPACRVQQQVTLCYWSNSNQPQIQNKTPTKNTHDNCPQQQNSFNLFHCSYWNNILLISAKCWMVRYGGVVLCQSVDVRLLVFVCKQIKGTADTS